MVDSQPITAKSRTHTYTQMCVCVCVVSNIEPTCVYFSCMANQAKNTWYLCRLQQACSKPLQSFHSAYLPGGHSLCMTRVSTKLGRPAAEASELVTCFGGGALEGGLKRVGRPFLDSWIRSKAYSGCFFQIDYTGFTVLVTDNISYIM